MGTDTGGFLGFPPTGTPFRFPGVFLFWLKDGQIVRDRRIYDRGSLLLQLATKADGPVEIGRLYRETIERARLEQNRRSRSQPSFRMRCSLSATEGVHTLKPPHRQSLAARLAATFLTTSTYQVDGSALRSGTLPVRGRPRRC